MLWFFDHGYKHLFWNTSKCKVDWDVLILDGMEKLLNSLILFRITEGGYNFGHDVLSEHLWKLSTSM